MSSCRLSIAKEAYVLTHIHPSRLRLPCRTRPLFHGPASPARSPGRSQGPPGAQSPFARGRCYLLRRDVSRHIGGHYPSFIAHTGSCARPKPSRCLRLSLLQRVFAGCRQSLLGDGPSRRYLRASFSACLDLCPGASLGAPTRFFPEHHRPSPRLDEIGFPTTTHTATSVWEKAFEAAVI